MKFSYQWISELVPGLEIDPAELQNLITIKSAECEGIEAVGTHFAQLRAVRVISAQRYGKGKNQVVTVELDHGVRKQVVCGAANVVAGMIAAWVPPGTRLGAKTISSAVIEGVESEGMLASAAELGISRDHSGIVVLEGMQPGQTLSALPSDWIIEIDNKSLTHRPDLWGHIGMAREVAAITGLQLVDPIDTSNLLHSESPIEVAIEDFRLCPRYTALMLEGVQVAPSPLALQARLESIGINPINNVVDITNYVLAELPQPMHAFDADKLHGNRITVRLARRGETLRALNGETYELDPQDLVIADGAGPIALAGVIGGADSAISETTTRVVLESANFEATNVRLTSARHKLRTDASVRYEKSLDPTNTDRGLARALALLQSMTAAIRPVGGVSEQRVPPAAAPPIALSVEFVVRKLGKQIPEEQISHILTSLGFGAQRTAPGLLTVTVPSWRTTKDISLKDDLVEEVGRMIGYDSIEPQPPLIAAVVPPATPMRLYLRQIRNGMAAQGFTETYNYSFINEQDAGRFGPAIAEHIAVRNPIASELTHLRRSLLPGIFRNIVSNVRHSSEFRIFEIGNEIHPAVAPSEGGTARVLPTEIPHLCAAMYNQHGDERDFFELKRVLECLWSQVELRAIAPARPFEHPTRVASVVWGEETVGRFFELHPSCLHAEGVEGRAFVMDLDLRLLHRLTTRSQVRYSPLRKYPTSGFDLSILTALHLAVAQIEADLRALGGSDIVMVDFVRQYAGPPLSDGQKSVSYHLEAGAPDHTLTAEEATDIRQRLIDGMRSRGYELRV